MNQLSASASPSLRRKCPWTKDYGLSFDYYRNGNNLQAVADKNDPLQPKHKIPVMSIPSPLSPPNTDLSTPTSVAPDVSPRPLGSPHYNKNHDTASSQGTTPLYLSSRWKSPAMGLSHTITSRPPSRTNSESASETPRSIPAQDGPQQPQVIARPLRPISRSRDMSNMVVSPADLTRLSP